MFNVIHVIDVESHSCAAITDGELFEKVRQLEGNNDTEPVHFMEWT
jgi:hypothetical protein